MQVAGHGCHIQHTVFDFMGDPAQGFLHSSAPANVVRDMSDQRFSVFVASMRFYQSQNRLKDDVRLVWFCRKSRLETETLSVRVWVITVAILERDKQCSDGEGSRSKAKHK